MAERMLHCASCGTAVDAASVFCPECGKPIVRPLAPPPPAVAAPTAQRPPSPPPAPAPAPARHRRRWPVVVAVLLVAGLLVGILAASFGALLGPKPVGKTGRLSLGEEKLVATQDLPAAGGQVSVSGTDTALDGFAISVADGAYPDGTTFSVRTADVTKQTFGPLFHAATPLIRVDNGHAFAAEPMTVRIPVRTASDEFAMAFFYDDKTGALEGIPTAARDADSITVVTRHFSDLVVTKAKYAELDALVKKGPVDSGFRPGTDDLFAPNYGSWAAPGGHCAGQSIATMYYYDALKATKQAIRANPDIDDGPYAATPDLYWDDASAYRLCSLVHQQYAADWGKAHDALRDADEEWTYYEFLYAIHLTGLPQYVDIRTTDMTGGHAMIVYAVTKDGLRICDPNYPGEQDRVIPAERTLDAALEREKVSLGTYLTKPNVKGKVRTYPWISYYGAYALVDKTVLADDWKQALAGSDPAQGIFPADLDFGAATDRGTDGKLVVSPLAPGGTLRVSQAGLEAVQAGAGAKLYLAPAVRTLGMTLTFYRGDQEVGTTSAASQAEDKWFIFELQPGRNDLGILYEDTDANGGLHYVDFQRFFVDYAPAGTPAATPAADASAFTGSWEFSEIKLGSYTGMAQSFRDEIVHDGGDPDKWVLYYISDFNDVLMGCKDLKESGASVIGMGPPPADAGAKWAGAAVYFQTNSNHYIGNFNVVVDGVQQNYRYTTIPTTLQPDGSLRVTGFEGCGGLDKDDMDIDMVLVPTGAKTLSVTGTTTIHVGEKGTIVVSFTGTLVRTGRNPGLEPEYGS